MYTILKKIVALILFIAITFFSCKNDDSITTDEESSLLDLNKLEQDKEYTEYVTNIYEISKQIIDPIKASEIAENNEELTGDQKIELSEAMGFNTVADLENFYTSQAQLMLVINKRYDLENINDISVENIFNQIMLNNRNNELRISITNKSKNNEIPPECLDIWDACDDSLFLEGTNLNNADYLNEYFCSSFDEGSTQWTACTNLVSRRLALDWAVKETDWCLCMQADCNWPDEVYRKCEGPIIIPDPNI